MSGLITLMAALLAMAAGMVLYLSSSHQGWRARALPLRISAAWASGLCLAALGLQQPSLGWTAALAQTLAWLMLACTVLPFVQAWRQARVRTRHVG